MIIFGVITFTFLFSVLFLFNNYNMNRIYSLKSLDYYYEVSGYLIFNQKQNILIINDINFQSDVVGTSEEPKIKLLNIFITYEGKKLMSYTENIVDEYDNNLSSVLDNLSFSIEDNKDNNSNIINYDIDLSKIKIEIEYIKEDDESVYVELDTNFEEIFSNNKLIY